MLAVVRLRGFVLIRNKCWLENKIVLQTTFSYDGDENNDTTCSAIIMHRRMCRSGATIFCPPMGRGLLVEVAFELRSKLGPGQVARWPLKFR